MAIHKLSLVFPLKFLWLTFSEDVSHGRFGPRQHKIPEDIKIHVCLWHMALAFDNQKRQTEKKRENRGKMSV